MNFKKTTLLLLGSIFLSFNSQFVEAKTFTCPTPDKINWIQVAAYDKNTVWVGGTTEGWQGSAVTTGESPKLASLEKTKVQVLPTNEKFSLLSCIYKIENSAVHTEKDNMHLFVSNYTSCKVDTSDNKISPTFTCKK